MLLNDWIRDDGAGFDVIIAEGVGAVSGSSNPMLSDLTQEFIITIALFLVL